MIKRPKVRPVNARLKRKLWLEKFAVSFSIMVLFFVVFGGGLLIYYTFTQRDTSEPVVEPIHVMMPQSLK